jgi:hypothetical protein
MNKDDKLIAALDAAEGAADSPELAEERAVALQYYNGDPFGNEVSGRSQYVSRDVHNAVEGMKPSLLKIFSSTDEVVSFTPTGAEDVPAAEQESAYINYLFTQKNNGFLLLEQWFHDALLLKNGYIKVYWDETEDIDTEKYAGLNEDMIALLLADQSLDVVSQEQDEYGLYTIEVRQKRTYGCVKLDVLPPENCKVSHTCPSADVGEADFFQYWDYKSISWLREQGYDVPDDISDDGDESYEEWVRNQQSDSDQYGDETNAVDPSMRYVKVKETWLRYDYDEDGKAELNHIISVGSEILLREDIDDINVASICPYPMPHRHVGRSIADDTMHYQEVKSYLWRSYIDNLALANNGRYAISDRVNLQDMLVSRPGGVVRVDGEPGAHILPLTHPTKGGEIIQGIEFLQSAEENDTGVTRYNQGLDANSLNKTATGMSMIMNASQLRVELIARNFAEVGVKRLFWLMHKLTKQNATQPEVFRLRNNWVPVDPRSWKTRYDLSISVGLGTGDKNQQLMHLQNILMAQKEALQIGVATPQNIHHSLTKLTENAGFKDVENFWTDPATQEPKPPQPSPEEIKMQGEMQKHQMTLQSDAQKSQFEAQQQAMLEEMKQNYENQRKQMDIALEQWKAQLQASTQLTLAQISAQTTLNAQQDAASDAAVGD